MNGIDKIIEIALAEDIHTGDITTLAMLPKARRMRARLVAKEPMVLAGLAIAERVFARLDPSARFEAAFCDADRLPTVRTCCFFAPWRWLYQNRTTLSKRFAR